MSQDTADLELIKQTVQYYFDGLYHSDVEKLKKAFHPNSPSLIDGAIPTEVSMFDPKTDVSVTDDGPKLLKKACENNIETVWQRHEAQQPQCGFCDMGLSCKICIMGPCRHDQNCAENLSRPQPAIEQYRKTNAGGQVYE